MVCLDTRSVEEQHIPQVFFSPFAGGLHALSCSEKKQPGEMTSAPPASHMAQHKSDAVLWLLFVGGSKEELTEPWPRLPLPPPPPVLHPQELRLPVVWQELCKHVPQSAIPPPACHHCGMWTGISTGFNGVVLLHPSTVTEGAGIPPAVPGQPWGDPAQLGVGLGQHPNGTRGDSEHGAAHLAPSWLRSLVVALQKLCLPSSGKERLCQGVFQPEEHGRQGSPYIMGVLQVPLCHLWLQSPLRTLCLAMVVWHRTSKVHSTVLLSESGAHPRGEPSPNLSAIPKGALA